MTPISSLPDFDWNEIARREISMTGEELISQSTDHIPIGALTAVDEDEPLARRFAIFYGFEPTEELRSYHGHQYRIFRRA